MYSTLSRIFLFLSICCFSQSLYSQIRDVYIYTNDTASVHGQTVKVTVDFPDSYTSTQMKLKALNAEIADFGGQATLDANKAAEVTINIKKFGVAAFTMAPSDANEKKRLQSFKIVMVDAKLTDDVLPNYARASLYADKSSWITNSESGMYKSVLTVYAKGIRKPAAGTHLAWTVKVGGAIATPDQAQLLATTTDTTCKVFFKQAGSYEVQLVARKGGQEQVAALLKAEVTGANLSEYEYLPQYDFITKLDVQEVNLNSSYPNYVVGKRVFSLGATPSSAKAYILDSFDLKLHPIADFSDPNAPNFTWKDSSMYEDTRTITDPFLTQADRNNKRLSQYYVRRLANGKVYMVENLRYYQAAVTDANTMIENTYAGLGSFKRGLFRIRSSQQADVLGDSYGVRIDFLRDGVYYGFANPTEWQSLKSRKLSLSDLTPYIEFQTHSIGPVNLFDAMMSGFSNNPHDPNNLLSGTPCPLGWVMLEPYDLIDLLKKNNISYTLDKFTSPSRYSEIKATGLLTKYFLAEADGGENLTGLGLRKSFRAYVQQNPKSSKTNTAFDWGMRNYLQFRTSFCENAYFPVNEITNCYFALGELKGAAQEEKLRVRGRFASEYNFGQDYQADLQFYHARCVKKD